MKDKDLHKVSDVLFGSKLKSWNMMNFFAGIIVKSFFRIFPKKNIRAYCTDLKSPIEKLGTESWSHFDKQPYTVWNK